jgi:hypothetical protein
MVFAIVAVVLAAWTVIDSKVGETEQDIALSATARFSELGSGSATQRAPVWRANLRAWSEDPVTGSGPATGWGGFLRNATADEIRRSDRGYADAHNLFVEMLATTGLLGAAALLALVALLVWRIGLVGPDRAWAAGGVIAVGLVHLLQPLNIVLTPLLFVLAGLAVGPPRRATKLSGWLGIAVAVMLVLSLGRFTASWMQRYGDSYNSLDSVRTATKLEPRRLGAAVELARFLAFEYRTGDADARTEARAVMANAVRWHAWSPSVRLDAADVESIMEDRAGALEWIERHLEIFPNDPRALAGKAVLVLERGERDDARALAERALEIDDAQTLAQTVLDRLDAEQGPR